MKVTFLLLFISASYVLAISDPSLYGTKISETCSIPKGRETCGPHFVIVGSMKSGTTSLFSYLQNHPQVLPLKPDAKLNGRAILADKEIRFFLDPSYSSFINKFGYEEAIGFYYDIFPDIYPENSTLITGEASPMYVVSKKKLHFMYFPNKWFLLVSRKCCWKSKTSLSIWKSYLDDAWPNSKSLFGFLVSVRKFSRKSNQILIILKEFY